MAKIKIGKGGTSIPGSDKIAVKGNPQQMRKIRCPGCQQLAVTQRNEKGQIVATCNCGRSFISKAM